jgi:ESCRT-II complex subunit VPS36
VAANIHDDFDSVDRARPDSPGPSLAPSQIQEQVQAEYMKISFRAGGDKVFHERLKAAMVQRKWLLQNAPAMPSPLTNTELSNTSTSIAGPSTGVGIAGLERLHLSRQRNNETVISSAFSDLEALMASAKEIIALAESFAGSAGSLDSNTTQLLSDSAAGLGMSMTKDMLDASGGAGDSLYLSELSRSLAEYLTDDRQAILKRSGGIIALVDLWATFNRARNGVELVSPSDFEKAARLWGKLGLPVRLREFRNGLLVVQRQDWTDDKTIAQLLAWLQEFHNDSNFREGVAWDQSAFGRGVTAHETASKFGWSVGVATEELEMAEEKGVLCREEGIEGLKFWENFLVDESLSNV